MRTLPEGTLTFVFTDIEGSTSLLHKFGELYANILEQHNTIIRECCESHGGNVVDHQGDSFFMVFQNAKTAIISCIEAQRRFFGNKWPSDIEVRVRMAIHTGEAKLTPMGYVGVDVHRGARLSKVAHGGQILISSPVFELLRNDIPPGIALKDLGLHKLKDMPEEQHLYQVVCPDLLEEFPPLRTIDYGHTNLPKFLTNFIGHEEELKELKTILPTCRLITLTGVGGVGKTRLAVQLASDIFHDFKDGIWFVDLSILKDPAMLEQCVTFNLKIREEAGKSLQQVLLERIGEREMLIIMDNCEQVAEHCAKLTSLMLKGCPDIKIIATSREVLGVEGEVVWRVSHMALPEADSDEGFEKRTSNEALRLFEDRAASNKAGFKITKNNIEVIENICRKLDGNPLAIELAAARIIVLTPGQIVERLSECLKLLGKGTKTSSPRQQTLRAVMDWSYDILPDKEKALFRRLSVFLGSFTLEAVEKICSDEELPEPEVLDLLGQLANKSLLVVNEKKGVIRYRLLETIRQYAVEKLKDAFEHVVTRDKHLNYFLDYAQKNEKELIGQNQTFWLNSFELEHDNFNVALQRTLDTKNYEKGLKLANAIEALWFYHGHFNEGRTWLDKLMDSSQELSLPLMADALKHSATMAKKQHDIKNSRLFFEQSLTLFKKLDDKPSILEIMLKLGDIAMQEGKYDESLDYLKKSMAVAQAMGSKPGMTVVLESLGTVYTEMGDYEQAEKFLLEAHTQSKTLKSRNTYASILRYLGYLSEKKNEVDQAAFYYNESLSIYYQIDSKDVISYLLCRIGATSRKLKKFDVARLQINEALQIARKIKNRRWEALCMAETGCLEMDLGNFKKAAICFAKAYQLFNELDDKINVLWILELMVFLAVRTEKYENATELFGFIDNIRTQNGWSLRSPRALFDEYLGKVSEVLPEDKFNKHWEDGKNLDISQAFIRAHSLYNDEAQRMMAKQITTVN